MEVFIFIKWKVIFGLPIFIFNILDESFRILCSVHIPVV